MDRAPSPAGGAPMLAPLLMQGRPLQGSGRSASGRCRRPSGGGATPAGSPAAITCKTRGRPPGQPRDPGSHQIRTQPPMPHLTTDDNIELYYQEVGGGTPIAFVHEFAGDHRSWEPQMPYFARRYRCIAYNARG